jgi:MSHA biogenesis protein MshL
MKNALAASLACGLVIGGCASQVIPPGETLERVSGELRKAAQPRPLPAQPEAVRQALLPPVVVEMPAANVPTEPRFNLVVNNVPANQVFMAMVSDTRYSMLVHQDAHDPISITLKDVTVREALDALRELYGYDYKIQGNRIFVQPPGLQTRVFQVNYLMGRRVGRADVRVTSGSIQTPSFSAPPQGGAGATGSGAAPVAAGAGASSAQSVESSRVTTTSDNDFWRDLTDALNAIVSSANPVPGMSTATAVPGSAPRPAAVRSDSRAVVVNPQAGVVVVRGYAADMRNVETFLKAMSLVVERQVMLEAKIIEVTLNDGFQAGINWGAFRTGNNSRFSTGVVAPGSTVRTDGAMGAPTATSVNGILQPGSPFTTDPARAALLSPDPLGGTSPGSASSAISLGANAVGSVFGLALQTSSFAALLNFLESHGAVQVLSSPRIATMNNQKAVLKVGTDEFFVTNVTTTTTTAGTNTVVSPTITTQPFFSGIALDVTPQISEDSQITLHIHPSVSLVTDKPKTLNLGALGNFTLPLASSNINESDTIVRVNDGSIVAIGGLMRQAQNDARSQVPGIGDAPGIGGLFRNRAQAMSKSELVILLKTTVIQGDGTWQQQAQEVGDRIQGMQRTPARAAAAQ